MPANPLELSVDGILDVFQRGLVTANDCIRILEGETVAPIERRAFQDGIACQVNGYVCGRCGRLHFKNTVQCLFCNEKSNMNRKMNKSKTAVINPTQGGQTLAERMAAVEDEVASVLNVRSIIQAEQDKQRGVVFTTKQHQLSLWERGRAFLFGKVDVISTPLPERPYYNQEERFGGTNVLFFCSNNI